MLQATFSLFFDTGGRRRCYLAPERICSSAQLPPEGSPGGGGPELQPAMDVFSLGCVLAELFMDGQPLFDYSKARPAA